ncbi:MAG TPA: hypothetical protein VMH90_04110 [Thermoplasmata archaeon]|nr:hypothetical protein [Thermoplasmata archaeon]
MTSAGSALATNARWEVTRLRRSRRIWLLIIPVVAGPVGSAVADLYLKVPSAATAVILGALVTAGLAGLILLDLTALAVGEDLAARSSSFYFALPQPRAPMLAGRLLVVVGGCLAAYAIGAAAVWALGGTFTSATDLPRPPLFIPAHLLLAIPALLVFLAGVVAVAAIVTRTASEAIVAGILAGVVVAGGAGYLVSQGTIGAWFPVLLALAGLGALGWAIYAYPELGG